MNLARTLKDNSEDYVLGVNLNDIVAPSPTGHTFNIFNTDKRNIWEERETTRIKKAYDINYALALKAEQEAYDRYIYNLTHPDKDKFWEKVFMTVTKTAAFAGVGYGIGVAVGVVAGAGAGGAATGTVAPAVGTVTSTGTVIATGGSVAAPVAAGSTGLISTAVGYINTASTFLRPAMQAYQTYQGYGAANRAAQVQADYYRDYFRELKAWEDEQIAIQKKKDETDLETIRLLKEERERKEAEAKKAYYALLQQINQPSSQGLTLSGLGENSVATFIKSNPKPTAIILGSIIAIAGITFMGGLK